MDIGTSLPKSIVYLPVISTIPGKEQLLIFPAMDPKNIPGVSPDDPDALFSPCSPGHSPAISGAHNEARLQEFFDRQNDGGRWSRAAWSKAPIRGGVDGAARKLPSSSLSDFDVVFQGAPEDRTSPPDPFSSLNETTTAAGKKRPGSTRRSDGNETQTRLFQHRPLLRMLSQVCREEDYIAVD